MARSRWPEGVRRRPIACWKAIFMYFTKMKKSWKKKFPKKNLRPKTFSIFFGIGFWIFFLAFLVDRKSDPQKNEKVFGRGWFFSETFFFNFFCFRKIHEYSFPASYRTPPNSLWSSRTSNLKSQTGQGASPSAPILLQSWVVAAESVASINQNLIPELTRFESQSSPLFEFCFSIIFGCFDHC